MPEVPETIDLTGDSDVDDNHIPEIGHSTTLRANILRGFFNRSQTKSPIKPSPASPTASQHPPSSPTISKPPQKHSPFLDMIRSRRGFPTSTKPPKDPSSESQVDEAGRAEDDVSSTKTHESSMADIEVSSFPYHCLEMTHSFISDPLPSDHLS